MTPRTTVDGLVERCSRWLAARSTRRSFLGRAGRVGVFVAVGPTLATFLAGRAEARVCGQSGVSPKCPTFDCTDPGTTWGWCWYASGDACCSGGLLKKICDCCKQDHPNTHGYCPEGTNVYCIVESCWADPRIMTVPVVRLEPGRGAPDMSVRVSRFRFPTGAAATPVLADGSDRLAVAVAAALAGRGPAPLLLTSRYHLPVSVVAELQRLRAGRVRLVGPALSAAVREELARYGLVGEPVGDGADTIALSLELARAQLDAGGPRFAVCLGTDEASSAIAPTIGALAASAGLPLVLGTDAARVLAGEGRLDGVYLVGPTLGAASLLPGAVTIEGTGGAGLARAAAATITGPASADGFELWIVDAGDPELVAGLAGTSAVILTGPRARLDVDAEAWVLSRQGVRRAVWVADRIDDESLYRLQGALNHFDTHRLTGVPGQGLPVVSQPYAERGMGLARVAGVVPDAPEVTGSQWISRANPTRRG